MAVASRLEASNHPDAVQEAGVISRRKFISRAGGVLLGALFAISLGAASSLRAQSPEMASRLPSSTIGFIEWHGTSVLAGSAQSNHVLQLLGDPEMMPLWAGLAANFQQRSASRKNPPPPLSLPEAISLLQNPAVFGVIENPASPTTTADGKPPARVAAFLVYDATGKTQVIEKWKAAAEARGPQAPKVSHYDFGGTPVEVQITGKNENYTAQDGNYFLMSDQKLVIEDLITRFRGSTPPATSVMQLPEYGDVQKFIGSGAALDFFARMPNVNDWAATNAKNQAGAKFIRNIHLEKVHAAGGSLSFAGVAMEMRGEILGDTMPIGPFDIAGASSASFRTQGIASEGPEYSVSRVNLAAMYRLFRGAIVANLPPQQAANVETAESAAQSFLGMPVADALELFTGELASVSSYSADGTEQRIFAASIQKPDAVLRILRAVIGPMILSEDSAGDATFIDIAYPYRDPATGLRRRKLYYLAVTPQMLMVAPRKAMLRETLERVDTPAEAGGASARGMFAEAQYAQMRSLLPKNLSGLGVADFGQIPWGPLFANLEARSEQAARESSQPAKNPHPPDFGWLKLVNPEVIQRHLHMVLSGWWKDTNGVYFESYVQ